MAKSDVTIEQAQAVIDRVAQELGLLQKPTSGFLKVEGPTNKHRVYVQKSRSLGRIDCTIDLPTDDPAYKQLSAPNGSVKCHVVPDLVQLERVLRMLGDSNLGVQVPNKPRPFAATKQPPRKPKAVAAPVPEEALEPAIDFGDGQVMTMKDRALHIRDRARAARANMLLENADKYGEMTYEEAYEHVVRKTDLAELAEAHRARLTAETQEVLAEAGIEIEA